MSKRHFVKELVSNAVYDRHGKPVPFQVIGQNYGVLTLDTEKDAELITDLEKLRAMRRGGIVPCTQEELDKKKEMFPFVPSGPQLDPPVRVYNPPSPRKAGEDVAVAGELPPGFPLAKASDFPKGVPSPAPVVTPPVPATAAVPVQKLRTGRVKKTVPAVNAP